MTSPADHRQLSWDGIDVDAMDCEADNLAVLLRSHGAQDVLSPFASEWHLALDADGDLELGRTPVDDLVTRFTGATVHRSAPTEDELAALVATTPALAYADAYFLPWLPYFGTSPMEHSLLLTGLTADGRAWTVTDAYHNITQWGAAAPVHTVIDRFGLRHARAVLDGPRAGTIVTVQPGDAPEPPPVAAILTGNAIAITDSAQAGVLTAYVDGFRATFADPDQVAALTLGCWLAHRRRDLHGRWLRAVEAEHPGALPDGFVDRYRNTVVAGWRRAQEFAYIAQRRSAHGKAAPTTALDLLASEVGPAEAELAERLGDHVGAGAVRTAASAGRR